MFWIATGSIIIIFFSIRAYLNNVERWRMKKFSFPKAYYLFLQFINILIIFAGVLFLMLSIVSHLKGFQIQFSSDFGYHMRLIPDPR